MPRFVVALLTCLSLLHLTLVGAELVPCASHHAAEMHAGAGHDAGAMTMTHGRAMARASVPTDDVPTDCRVPAPSTCCSAASVCGSTVAITAAPMHAGGPVNSCRAVHPEPGALQVAVAPAPEPPPPRA